MGAAVIGGVKFAFNIINRQIAGLSIDPLDRAGSQIALFTQEHQIFVRQDTAPNLLPIKYGNRNLLKA